ncbi:glycosyl hydrolase [Flammeovirga sp. SJP92]|uniref:glycosyl hydrolase n=1 Tax=Flammeovirga sp. SJP92 TaxID=1775430 RepID=UPI00155F7D7D|nr:glycosyl hydrolase [Flammeovirga sp. SJP92]
MKYNLILFLFIFTACMQNNDDNIIGEDEDLPVVEGFQKRSEKRGVSFAFKYEDDVTVLGEGISWSYNWSPLQYDKFIPLTKEQNIEFCPMAWNGVNADQIRAYVQKNPDVKYLLAFNEPNLTDQANMTPQQAAERWGDVKAIAEELNLKIISPAMNYGTLEGYHDPIKWLDEFFELVPDHGIEGISIHCYMTSVAALKRYVEMFKKYNMPIWLTEFCAWEGNVTPESQLRYMSDALNYLESDPDVYRYAWFIPRGGGSEDTFPYMFLLKQTSDVQLTELGMVYNQMSSFDKENYFGVGQRIEAEHYSDMSISESVGEAGWTNGPCVRRTTESPNETLELYNFFKGQWVEYQLYVPKEGEYNLDIRYASFIDAQLIMAVDGVETVTMDITNTSENFIWNTYSTPVQLTAGKHTIRLTQNVGTISINWLLFNN